MKFFRLLALGAVCFAAGCATDTGIEPGKPVDIGHNVTIATGMEWKIVSGCSDTATILVNSAPVMRPEMIVQCGSKFELTVDGPGLDALVSLNGVAPGEPLLESRTESPSSVFKAGMVPDEVMELTVSSLIKAGFQQVKAAALRPAPFGKAEGFRFDLAFLTPDGLEMKGMAIAAVRDGKLDLVLFLAPNEYYFGRLKDEVERIFSSIQAD